MHEIRLPKYDENLDESLVTLWSKQVGDEIKVGDTLLEVQTGKAVDEIVSDVAGELVEIKAQRGDSALAGSVLGIIKEK